MKLTNMFVDHPCKILSANMICLLVFSILVAGPLNYMAIYESESGRDYKDWEHITTINTDKERLMWDHVNYIYELK